MPLFAQPAPDSTPNQPSSDLSSWQQRSIYFIMIDRFSDAGKPVNMNQGEFDPKDSHCFQGGNLEGIRQRLSYIKELGFDAIWITPPVYNQWVNERMKTRGYHGYWAWDFTQVDPHFGTLEEYQALVKAAHELDIRVIQDIVPGHTGDFFHVELVYSITPDTIKKLTKLNVPENVLQKLACIFHQSIIGREAFQKKLQAILTTEDYFGYQEIIEQNVAKQFIPESSWTPVKTIPANAPNDPIFYQNNPLNPQHRSANMYEYLPAIYDYGMRYQQLHYALADLDDINLFNPVARKRMLEIYRYWVEKVGIDGFRVDTVPFTPEDFYDYFMYNNTPEDPGIKPFAEKCGIPHFLSFGEIWFYDYQVTTKDGYHLALADYIQHRGKPRLDSAINFPLQHYIHKVFFHNAPTQQLIPFLTAKKPNQNYWISFIDNHDMDRVASKTNWENIQQALVCIYTIPGIPCITWGTEHGFIETRQNMFDSKYAVIDPNNPRMELLRKLNTLRHDPNNKVLVHGKLEILAESATTGILAYRMISDDDQIWVIFNTSPNTMLYTFPNQTQQFQTILSSNQTNDLVQKFLLLEPQSFYILRPNKTIVEETSQPTSNSNVKIKLASLPPKIDNNNPLTIHYQISGLEDPANFKLWLLLGHDYQQRIEIPNPLTNTNFTFSLADCAEGTYAVQLLGEIDSNFVVSNCGNIHITLKYQDYPNVQIMRKGTQGIFQQTIPPAPNADQPIITILPPPNWPPEVLNFSKVNIATSGKNMRLQMTMGNICQQWNPGNEFDHVNLHVFFKFPDTTQLPAKSCLPKLQGNYEDFVWHSGFVLGGWSQKAFESATSTEDKYGDVINCYVYHQVNIKDKTITIYFPSEFFAGLDQWQGTEILLTTWDADGIEGLRPLSKTILDWNFFCQNLKESDDVNTIPRIYCHQRIRLE